LTKFSRKKKKDNMNM